MPLKLPIFKHFNHTDVFKSKLPATSHANYNITRHRCSDTIISGPRQGVKPSGPGVGLYGSQRVGVQAQVQRHRRQWTKESNLQVLDCRAHKELVWSAGTGGKEAVRKGHMLA